MPNEQEVRSKIRLVTVQRIFAGSREVSHHKFRQINIHTGDATFGSLLLFIEVVLARHVYILSACC